MLAIVKDHLFHCPRQKGNRDLRNLINQGQVWDDLIGEPNVKFGGTAWVESISVISYFKPDVPYIVLHGQQVNGPRLDYGIIRKDYF